MSGMRAVLLIPLVVIVFCQFSHADEANEKAHWIAERQAQNRATFKKLDQAWVAGCLAATTVYVTKYRKIDDGLSPSFNAENICALVSDDDQSKARMKSGKDLKHQGCIDGIAMSMQMFDKSASSQKRKTTLAEYCM